MTRHPIDTGQWTARGLGSRRALGDFKIDLLLIAVGLGLLVAGAELLVRCGALVAARLGVSSLLIGLTVVAFGTSMPEVVASSVAAIHGSTGIAVGNVVGSNITNVLLVAGAAALVSPIAVGAASLRRDGAIALGTAGIFWVICWLQLLNAVTGLLLVTGLGLFIVLSYRTEKSAAAEPSATTGDGRAQPIWLLVAGALAGLALLIGGGQLLVTSAIRLASGLGVSEAVIGLTIVAVGTSLPELATTVLAARRGEMGIAFGNVVGSNIFNVLGIGGLTAILSRGDDVPARIIGFDLPVMLAATALLMIAAASGRRIGRLEGGALVAGFALYMGWVWL